MNKLLPICAILLLLSVAGGGQTLAESVDLTGTKMCGDPKSGKSVTLKGTVMKRHFADDELTPNGFVLRDRKDVRYYINVDSDFLKDRYSTGTIESLVDVLTVGKSLWVTTDLCGKIYVARAVKVLKM